MQTKTLTNLFGAPGSGCALLTMIAVLGIPGPPPASAQVRPAVVKNVDEPGRSPYQQYLSSAKGGLNCGGNFCNFALPAVPANKRLVITNFSGNLAFAGTGTLFRLTFGINPPNGPLFELPTNPLLYHVDTISADSPNRYAFNEKVLWFVEAGQTPSISFYGATLVDSWPQGFVITGYLIDLTM